MLPHMAVVANRRAVLFHHANLFAVLLNDASIIAMFWRMRAAVVQTFSKRRRGRQQHCTCQYQTENSKFLEHGEPPFRSSEAFFASWSLDVPRAFMGGPKD